MLSLVVNVVEVKAKLHITLRKIWDGFLRANHRR